MDELRGVVVATPATTHYETARQCLEAGKHVLVEKPITRRSGEAERLIALADRKGLVLMVGHTFIHNPAVQKLKSYMTSGELGQPYYLYARRTNMGPIRRDVNAIWDLAPHDISVFNYLLDAVPEWASAVGARVLGNGLQDVGFISLGYASGVVGHVHVSWADPYKVREIVVVGSDKRVVFDDLNALERLRVFEKGVRPVAEPSSYGEHQLEMRDGDIISPRVEVTEPLKNQCQHFLTCLDEQRSPITSAQDGLAVVQVMEAIDRSVELNGVPVKVAAGRHQPLVVVNAGSVNVLRSFHKDENGHLVNSSNQGQKKEAA
jgi:predicted dehydrogenase